MDHVLGEMVLDHQHLALGKNGNLGVVNLSEVLQLRPREGEKVLVAARLVVRLQDKLEHSCPDDSDVDSRRYVLQLSN